MKRKDVDEVNDFFDFSISSPALKIRRLDAELTPIIEEEIVNRVPENEERAIVLFNPKNNAFQSSPSLYISADSEFLSGFKNLVIWSSRLNTHESLVDETPDQDNGCLAIIPWVPSHSEHTEMENPAAQISESDMMDVDDMDVENDYNTQKIRKDECVATNVIEGFNQWHQHCLIQQPPNNFSTPITWFGRAA